MHICMSGIVGRHEQWRQPNSFCLCLHISLTHWGRPTHMCVSQLTILGSDHGLSPGRRQAIIWTNAGLLLIETIVNGDKLQWNFIRNWYIVILDNAFENVVWKMAAILPRAQCVNPCLWLHFCQSLSLYVSLSLFSALLTTVMPLDFLAVTNNNSTLASRTPFTN